MKNYNKYKYKEKVKLVFKTNSSDLTQLPINTQLLIYVHVVHENFLSQIHHSKQNAIWIELLRFL